MLLDRKELLTGRSTAKKKIVIGTDRACYKTQELDVNRCERIESVPIS